MRDTGAVEKRFQFALLGFRHVFLGQTWCRHC
jgi:hypothetical protein